ncbi:hypothetical protein JCGZ_05124 [Jatropha curcas]|uniref:Uncharacterized protein n=1 Tax=Jatropha curcas TaxID=180498 RepID=A0A067KV09_JATCU|nr:hypothetical protein JCGZ_05124 [Jatropha curcas]
MEPFIKHGMQLRTNKLEKVEKINLSWYYMASLVTLRGLLVDRAFMDACLHLWDSQAHVFQFGTHYEEMCQIYEEFVALFGSDSGRAPVAAPTWSGFSRNFMRMLGLSFEEAKELVVGDQSNLAMLIEQYLNPLDFADLEFKRFRTRALVFILVSTCILTSLVGWGDMRVADVVL